MKAREAFDDRLVQTGAPVDAVHRLQALERRVRGDVHDVVKVALHGARRAQTVERRDHEVAVAQPAVAIVPVAAAARGLGQRGRHGRDDGARVVERGELDGDRGSDDLFLPLERNAEESHPVVPVVARPAEEALADLARGLGHGLVGPEEQGDVPVEDERRLLHHGRDGGVRGEAQNQLRRHVPDVVAAEREGRVVGAVIRHGLQTDADRRAAGQWAQAPDDHHRVEGPAELLEARGEIRDLDDPAGVGRASWSGGWRCCAGSVARSGRSPAARRKKRRGRRRRWPATRRRPDPRRTAACRTRRSALAGR